MQMDGWQDRLHISFLGEHFLFGGFRIDSLLSFFLASLLTVCFCLTERMLTFALSKHWNPFKLRSPLRVALWRAGLYWLVTFDRLIYMLVAMTFHLGIIAVTVTALSVGQFVVEYTDAPHSPTRSPPKHPYLPHTSRNSDHAEEPLLSSTYAEDEDFSSPVALPVFRTHPQYAQSPTNTPLPWQQQQPRIPGHTKTPIATGPHSKSKPEEIFIHPTRSNILRAEALVIQAGFTTAEPSFIDASSYTYPRSPDSSQDQVNKSREGGWGGGKGRDLARDLLLGRQGDTKEGNTSRQGGANNIFHIGDDED